MFWAALRVHQGTSTPNGRLNGEFQTFSKSHPTLSDREAHLSLSVILGESWAAFGERDFPGAAETTFEKLGGGYLRYFPAPNILWQMTIFLWLKGSFWRLSSTSMTRYKIVVLWKVRVTNLTLVNEDVNDGCFPWIFLLLRGSTGPWLTELWPWAFLGWAAWAPSPTGVLPAWTEGRKGRSQLQEDIKGGCGAGVRGRSPHLLPWPFRGKQSWGAWRLVGCKSTTQTAFGQIRLFSLFFRNVFSLSVKNNIGILTGITLHLQITLGCPDTFTELIPVGEHEILFSLFASSQFLSSTSYTFQCTDLFPPWLNFFPSILFILLPL